ncbi:pyruvate formate lyase family protein [Hominenteromicrobium sp.]|uniref:pyruvate formate lyase family protein n=1 Tax=Hominenteromicrobium sp. TaxID=3073581 RepID=UPI00399ADD7A
MDENDGIAGRYEHDFVGFSSQVGGIYTYYFNEHEFLNAYMACKQNGEITAAEDYALQAVQAYWHEEKHRAQRLNWNFRSATAMCRRKLFPVRAWASCDCRVAGYEPRFPKTLIRLGFDGLDQEIDRAAEVNGASSFYTALKLWIESLRGACEALPRIRHWYCRKSRRPKKPKRALQKLAEALLNIQHSTPKTFLEGVQLMWIYAVSGDIMNYSRMDDCLGRSMPRISTRGASRKKSRAGRARISISTLKRLTRSVTAA